MVLHANLLESWEKAVIAIAILFVVVYFCLVYYSLKSLFYFKKRLKSYEVSIKMAVVETITLIRELAKSCDYQLDEETSDKLEKIEVSAANNEVKGCYKEVLVIYSTLFNKLKGQNNDENRLLEINNNLLLQKEIDKLYQKALFYHNADLTGYNYWVKFIPTKPFTLMFKFKKRDSIY